ncbi:molybdenum cofactor guanylyltransferase [Sphingobium sufflavum]|uniref:molybdenum cofactor guanylyltransferase n=1 Tax=Sphingobium sufflavum TaxID=1129547 RepID=UPI001F30B826|nr:molybdenum cofactor guanylyltransferase [Sphingobium sufflavum]MCE7797926.1 molybdenum cofactor guanylyltransferase [Sphingobium sufflavum]
MNDADHGSIVGAVLAGGLSTRFGSDKAQALLDGRRLIDHAVDTLAAQCDAVIVVGRQEPGHDCAPDWPVPHQGPLGGIAGALRHAAAHGHAAVLTCGVDSPYLPANLRARLAPAPACLAAQPVIGLWPVTALPILEAILTTSASHAVRHFADRIGARRIETDSIPANVNRREDLDKLAR